MWSLFNNVHFYTFQFLCVNTEINSRGLKHERQQLTATMEACSVILATVYRSLQKQQLPCAGGDKCVTINSGNSGSK